MSQEAGAPRPPGLVDSLSRLGRSGLALLRTRLQILGTEIEEERIRFVRLALAVAAVAFCLQMAVLLFVLFMAVFLWETHRLATLAVFAAIFLIAGVAGALVLKQRLARRPKMFASSLGELAKDEERLQ
jgi:uncharacterized membrane protein YqjE